MGSNARVPTQARAGPTDSPEGRQHTLYCISKINRASSSSVHTPLAPPTSPLPTNLPLHTNPSLHHAPDPPRFAPYHPPSSSSCSPARGIYRARYDQIPVYNPWRCSTARPEDPPPATHCLPTSEHPKARNCCTCTCMLQLATYAHVARAPGLGRQQSKGSRVR